MLGKDTLMQVAQVMAPRVAARLPDEVPAANVAPKIANTILGVFVAVLGLGLCGLAAWLIVQTKTATALNLGLLGGGVVVIFIGGSLADPEVLGILKQFVGLAKSVKELKP